jgi:predicted nucleic acid-binding protein
MRDKYFIDTNILVYANDNSEIEKNSISREIIINGIKNENAVISTQVLSEFYVTVTKKIKKTLAPFQARKEIELLRSLELVELTINLILKAIDISEKYKLSYWDSLIIVAAINAKCSIIYSEDLSSGQKFESVKIINPYED